jgi:hypothetical protein
MAGADYLPWPVFQLTLEVVSPLYSHGCRRRAQHSSTREDFLTNELGGEIGTSTPDMKAPPTGQPRSYYQAHLSTTFSPQRDPTATTTNYNQPTSPRKRNYHHHHLQPEPFASLPAIQRKEIPRPGTNQVASH